MNKIEAHVARGADCGTQSCKEAWADADARLKALESDEAECATLNEAAATIEKQAREIAGLTERALAGEGERDDARRDAKRAEDAASWLRVHLANSEASMERWKKGQHETANECGRLNDERDALKREVERMKLVVDAAVLCATGSHDNERSALRVAVHTYRAATAPAERKPPFVWSEEQRAGLVKGARVGWIATGDGKTEPEMVTVREAPRLMRGIWWMKIESGDVWLECCDPSTLEPATLTAPEPKAQAGARVWRAGDKPGPMGLREGMRVRCFPFDEVGTVTEAEPHGWRVQFSQTAVSGGMGATDGIVLAEDFPAAPATAKTGA